MELSPKDKYILGGIFSVLIIFSVLWFFPRWQSALYMERFPPEVLQKLEPAERVQLEKNAAEIENSNRVTIAQIIGGLALLSGLYFTYLNVRTAQDNLRITEEGKLTERFSKGVELLGSDKLDVRLGGIFALERIARDSEKDNWTVMEVLTAFVREHSPNKLDPDTDETQTLPKQNDSLTIVNIKESIEFQIEKPGEDIQAIITVIGRRKWRSSETKPLNLQRVNLSKLDLSQSNFSMTDLKRANLSKANLSEADLSKANLSKANLSKANLSKANLIRSDLSHSNFSRAYLVKAYLIKANLSEANLSEANLSEAYLSKANLSEANLSKANVSEANVSEANLSEANLSEANLSEANLAKANLSRTNFKRGKLGRAYLYRADLREADLREADLGQANLIGADFRSADLSEANLSLANLGGADLSNADLEGADLSEADLLYVNLYKTRNLKIEQLMEANNYSEGLPTSEIEKELE